MKKIYALFACSLLFLVGLFVNADSNVSSDLANAYRWAYSYWITTLPMEQARLDEPITRQAAAKMIVKFSINALGRTPDFSKSCTFNDLSSFSTKTGFSVVWYYTYNGESYTYSCDLTE